MLLVSCTRCRALFSCLLPTRNSLPSADSLKPHAMARVQEVPPPVVSKAGSYTIFITPPAKLKPQRSQTSSQRWNAENAARRPHRESASPPPVYNPPPVQVPPPQFTASPPKFGFFWNALAKVQDAHSSLDRFLADWFGLNQSKYQWALDDFYDKNGMVGDSKKLNDQVQAMNIRCR